MDFSKCLTWKKAIMIEPQCLINVPFEENFWRVLGDFFRSANCLVNDIQRANCWAKHQWICFGYSSSREPPIEPKFFLELLTSYTHVFNTEARIFDHFLNFPNRATTQYTRTILLQASYIILHYFPMHTELGIIVLPLTQDL